MIARWVRVVENGKPNGWCGLVLAESRRELFWAIDEFVDPYAVELAPATRGGVFVREGSTPPPPLDPLSEHFPDEGWEPPAWEPDETS
jgi:hypothetical protein